MSVAVETVERTVRAIAEQSSLSYAYQDPTTGTRHTLTPEVLASNSGYLPAIVSAGEAVWREATGKGFRLDLARDPDALLGYRLRAIGDGSFSAVMLASMEALAQVSARGAVHVSDLGMVADAAAHRSRNTPSPVHPAAQSGARP